MRMSIRNNMFKIITTQFENYGGVTIDTPVFELKVLFYFYLRKYYQENMGKIAN